MSQDYFLSIEQASLGYDVPLIEEVNLSLQLGETALLVGNNGVGKTTMIKSILGQTPLLKGDISINGASLDQLESKQIAQYISVVYSKSPVPVHYTLVDLISLGKYIHYPYYFSLGKADLMEIDEIIEQLNLTPYRKLPLTKLSDGNLQKAFIGRALAQNSPMIILDEPTTHLDEDNKMMILSLLRNLSKKQNKLILFSSHDWRLAKEFTDRMCWVYEQQLKHGMTEDFLLTHLELTQPKLFPISPRFVAPKISAPFVQKEMLYSALQKNIEQDLSLSEIEYQEGVWFIKSQQSIRTCNSLEEVIQYLKQNPKP